MIKNIVRYATLFFCVGSMLACTQGQGPGNSTSTKFETEDQMDRCHNFHTPPAARIVRTIMRHLIGGIVPDHSTKTVDGGAIFGPCSFMLQRFGG
jgi:hypothetical protein